MTRDRRDFLATATLALLAQALGTRRLLAAHAPRKLHEWIRAHEELARKLATKLGNGDIRAPRIDWKTSVRLYG